MHFEHQHHKYIYCIVILILYLNKCIAYPYGRNLNLAESESTKKGGVVKKELSELPNPDDNNDDKKVHNDDDASIKHNQPEPDDNITTPSSINLNEQHQENPVIRPVVMNKINNNELPQSIKNSFYVFMALGLGAVVFITWKVYILRRSLAERRYGVHGDRGAQEMTPLPMSIEDDDSDIEDHTVFDINSMR